MKVNQLEQLLNFNLGKVMKNIANQYFLAWNNNSLEQLRPLFNDDVKLEDWETRANGIEEVLAANKQIFNDVPGIYVKVIDIATSDNQIMAQLVVWPSKEMANTIQVVDVLTIRDGKISSIKAYKK